MPRLRVEVDRPCDRSGVTFEERPGGRFCHACSEMQHDLRNATRREALALLEANGGRICGIFRAGPSGDVHFRPESPSRALQAARGAAMALALAGCGTPSETSPPTSAPTTTTPPASTPPSTIAIAPPPTTDADVHAMDASPNPADHETHTHMHEPAAVGVGSLGDIGLGHISGGARAVPVEERTPSPIGAEGPQGQLHVFADQITSSGPGSFDRMALVRMIRVRQGAMRACYQRELRSSPTLEGDVVIELTIAPSGAVANASVVRNAAGLDPVAACAVRVAQSFRFVPGPDGGAITYTVPLTFESSGP